MARGASTFCLVTCLAVLLPRFAVAAQDESPSQASARLSLPALEALVVGVALYPDDVLTQILDAATQPVAIHQAVDLSREEQASPHSELLSKSLPDSVRYLQQYPDVLVLLDEHLPITARLGIAYEEQPQDVWTAIYSVRARIDNELAAAAAEEDAAAEESDAFVVGGAAYGATTAYPYGSASGAVARTVLGAAALKELDERYDVVPATSASTTTSTSAAGAATVDGTTYFGAAGGGTATGPQGQSATAAGVATGSATQNENGVSYSTQAHGGYSASNGATGSATHSGSGKYNQNADGSVDFSRNASTQASGSNGQATVEHSGAGTYSGDGTSSYQGQTSVESSQGNLSTNTLAGGGQVSTTVATDQGEKTFTAGDGQVANAPSQGGDAARTYDRNGQQPYTGVTSERLSTAGDALRSNWGQLNHKTGGRMMQNMPAQKSTASGVAQPKPTPARARTTPKLSTGNSAPGARTLPGNSPSMDRSRPSAPTGSFGPSRPGGRRGRR